MKTKTWIGIACLAGAFYLRRRGEETIVTPILGATGLILLVPPALDKVAQLS